MSWGRRLRLNNRRNSLKAAPTPLRRPGAIQRAVSSWRAKQRPRSVSLVERASEPFVKNRRHDNGQCHSHPILEVDAQKCKFPRQPLSDPVPHKRYLNDIFLSHQH